MEAKGAYKISNEIALGIDPGYGRVGWGIVAGGSRCLDYGCIETPGAMPLPARYFLIKKNLLEIIDRWGPVVAGVELLFFGRNTTTAMRVSEARGVILLTLYEAGLPIYEPTPGQVKAEVAQGDAGKGAIQENVRLILGLKKRPRPDDAADALAVALYAGREWRVNQLVNLAG